jgi:serine protease inhibitor
MNPINLKLGGTLLAIALMLGAIGCQPGQSADSQKSGSNPDIPSTFGTAPSNRSEPIAGSPANGPSPNPAKVVKPVKPVSPKLIEAQTKFSFNLFSALQKQTPNKNLFISPISISQAIAMLYNGASGETQKAIGSTLTLGDLSLEDFNASSEDLGKTLEYYDPGVQLSTANSIWTNQNTPIKPDFLSRNRRFYRAKVESLDFTNPQSVKTINNWVKRNTQGKIEGIVEELKESDKLLLVNATYFKGAWTKPFNPELTKAQDFATPDGKKTVQMMDQQGSYRYFETDDLQAIALPYGKRRLNLYVLLPKDGKTIADLLPLLTQNAETDGLTSDWTRQFASNPGRIQLPRFKMESKLNLETPLTTLGMGIAFTPKADFSNLSDRSSQIDQVLHKTFVEVNEVGTEAAAVTSIGIRTTSAEMPKSPFTMKVDRPFLCILRDDQTGAILFMGAIVNP